jgi:uncharacterized membrane protein
MRSATLLATFAALAGLAGCAASERPYAPVKDLRYSAMGEAPFWLLTIGDDSILLSLVPEGRDPRTRFIDHAYPRVLPRIEGGVRTWESGAGAAVIAVRAAPGPCTNAGGAVYEDHVRIRLSGRELQGCGGRRLQKARG